MQKTTPIHKKLFFGFVFVIFCYFLEKNVKNWVMTMIKKRKGKKEIA